jgi:hypothetical protein
VKMRLVGPVLFLATFFTIYVQAIFEGGRFFVVALFIVVALSASQARHMQFSWRKAWIIIIGIAILGFSSLVFLDRATGQGQVLGESLLQFSTGFPLTLAQGEVWGGDSGVEAVYFVVSMFWVYITSAVNDLDVVLRTDVVQHAWGAYQFPQFWSFVSLLTGYQNSFSVFNLARTGVYVTAYGSWYIDFGHPGALLGITLQGFITGYATSLFNRGHLTRVAMLSPMLVVVGIFMPVHSILTTVWPAMIFVIIFGSNASSRPRQTVTVMPPNYPTYQGRPSYQNQRSYR